MRYVDPSLTVSKVIEDDGVALWAAGPFEVTLECAPPFGAPITIPGGDARTLDAG